ncbi:MAG: hypothetical protein M1608_13960, partial [Candidatus Omnitrophica bacterium]|nr:hypothetical protein [Candidatus Omnitrophota bacterium]
LFKLNPATTVIEIWTEFYQPPTPNKTETVWPLETDPQKRQVMAEPDLVNEFLDFGSMQTPSGKAYVADTVDGLSRPVSQRWIEADDRTFLVESVPFQQLKPLLESLPRQAKATAPSNGTAPKPIRMAANALPKSLPLSPTANLGLDRFTLIGSVPASGGNAAKSYDGLLAAFKAQPGLALDYQLVTSATNFVFKGDTTYYVKDLASFTGTNTVIEGGTVVKFTNSTSAQLWVQTPVECQTGPYSPAVFTSYCDDTVGATIPGSSGNPGTNYYGRGISVANGSNLRYLRFAYADMAVYLSSVETVTVAHSQFVKCRNPLWSYVYCTFNLQNDLFHEIDSLAYGDYLTVNGVHLTVHQCTNFFAGIGQATVNLTNSLLVSMEDWGDNCTPNTDETDFLADDNGQVFEHSMAGYHYLVDGTYRNKGSINIDPTLLSEIRQKTTFPPLLLTVPFVADTPLSDRPIRDLDAPDCGYHNDPIDYAWTGLNLTNATLTLTNGVAVCLYGVNGLNLQSGAKLYSEGTSVAFNHLFRYPAVQEQPVNLDGTTGTVHLMQINSAWSVLPEVRMRFTDISHLSDNIYRQVIIANSGSYPFSIFSFTECQLNGGQFYLRPYLYSDPRGMTATFTNNLVHRATITLIQGYNNDQTGLGVKMRNNLFYGCNMQLQNNTGTFPWAIYDNMFDRVSFGTCNSQFNTTGYNGYGNCIQALGGPGNVPVIDFTYAAGPFGDWYQTDTDLYDAGSQLASQSGLSNYTVKTDQDLDTGYVDIGYHYLGISSAAAANNVKVTIEATQPAASENYDGSVVNGTFTVTRSVTTNTSLTVTYQVSGTAVSDTDYDGLSGTVIIPAGTNAACITVHPINDDDVEMLETVTLSLDFNANYIVGSPRVATVTIESDDALPPAPFEVVTNVPCSVSIDYHKPSDSLIISANYATGTPYNFARLDDEGLHTNWPSCSGLLQEIKLATVKTTTNGFTEGEMYFGTGQAGVIGKMTANGSAIYTNWCTLPGEAHLLRGSLCVDQTGIFNHDLIVVTGDVSSDGGGVWRVNGYGNTNRIVDLQTHLEGVITMPNDPGKYGPLAGKILAGGKYLGVIFTIDTNGETNVFNYDDVEGDVGPIYPEDFEIIPADQDLYVCCPYGDYLRKVSREYFSGFVGDLLVIQSGENVTDEELPPRFLIFHWNGTCFQWFEIGYNDTDESVEQACFSSLDLP